MRRTFVLSFILSFSIGSTAVAAKLCVSIFSSHKVTTEIQKHIDATITNLAQLRVSLDLAQAKGSKSIELTALSANYSQKENELLTYLQNHQVMNREELIARIKLAVLGIQDRQPKNDQTVERQTRRINQDVDAIKELSVDGTRMIFRPIKPGAFKMGGYTKVAVEITRPFEMMATLTTQIIWEKVAELAEARFGKIQDLQHDTSFFKGETLPVESLTFDGIKKWIHWLNSLSKADDPGLYSLIKGFKKGDVFRLPTEAEWEFVIRGRGDYSAKYHFGDREKDLQAYAWTMTNSNGQTQPVAQRQPLIVDGESLFDMHGNVREWVADYYTDKFPGGKDPLVTTGGLRRVIRGGSFSSDYTHASVYRDGLVGHLRQNDVGFRLVREVQP